ncbi:unnamed protein product [Adineta steineri]|uniref:Uncharacterized protein n=1 Tax=Adineta steineri TaxID=433720 RepID=A0A819R8U9_9BILA|nr:unnamed protein product [Adineta steineri]CAF4043612.1 unnamed protein product [Adineta steineri]
MNNDETCYLVYVDLPTESLFEPYSRITHRYTDIDIAVTFIKSTRHADILLVVSDRLAKEILSRIKLCRYRHVRNIFILRQSIDASKIKFDKHDYLPEIFETVSELEHAVQTQIISMEKQAFPFSMFDQTQQSSKDVTKKFNTFLWYQVLFHTLKQLPADEQAREEMLQFCSNYYHSNFPEEQIIQEYRLNANEDNAIHW